MTDDSDATAGRSTDERTDVSADRIPTEPPIVLPDGGEEESESGGTEGDEESENGDTPEKSAQGERDADGEGTSLLYLDLSGLFVDLLGVEIELNRVELDLSAVPGPGNLLGNLLSQVVGLLDDVAGAIGDLVPEGGLSPGNLLPEIEIPSTSDVLFGAVNVVLDALLDALGDDETAADDDDGTDGDENGEADDEREANEDDTEDD
ncbi:hypothetical protein [Halococcus saccharolyticus]|uniref:Uncharacterized protein n=1 Tax=Halococcus saccharolyticus DSM 5350 TaxID=1227455 RepID=M0MLL7_9EURY|nr:hypothetical protein [Halococcus saccharolyticus]EMA46536.1 hypothetical protein C449_04285 [Halococcus saccharolyticus DSM 5350]